MRVRMFFASHPLDPLRPFTRARAKKLARAAECLIYSITPGGFWAAKRPEISDLRGFPRHFAMGPAGQRRRLRTPIAASRSNQRARVDGGVTRVPYTFSPSTEARGAHWRGRRPRRPRQG